MTLSRMCQLPLGLLLSCLAAGSPATTKHLSKRDPNYNVLNGANFPDPSLCEVDGTNYVFGTVDGAGNNVPLTINSDFNNAGGWSTPVEAFPQDNVPAVGANGWANPYTTWAPDVVQLTDYDDSFAMYYSAEVKGSNPSVHCVGLARSGIVQGPYNDSSSAPLICPQAAGGAIDPAAFLDTDNSRYIVYKIDGPAVNNGGYCNSPDNPPSTNTSLMLQQVANDGYTVIGGPTVLYNNQGVSDKYNVEAPSLYKDCEDTYFLFFSAGCTSDNSYVVDYVTATDIYGPYGNRQTLLQTGDFGEYGPGGADVANDLKTVYHSLEVSNDISYPRVLNTATLSLSGQTFAVN